MPSRSPKYQVIANDTRAYFFATREEAIPFAADVAKECNDEGTSESTRAVVWSLRSMSRVLTVSYRRPTSGEFMGEPWSLPAQYALHKHDRYGRELPGDVIERPS